MVGLGLVLVGGVLWTLAAAGPVSAQSPPPTGPREVAMADTATLRAERWRERRRAKKETLEHPRPSFIERLAGRAQGFVRENRIVIDLPDVDFYDVRPVLGGLRGGLSGGLEREWFEGRPSRQGLIEVLVSTQRYYSLRGAAGLQHQRWMGYGYARHRHRPRERFYGVGANTEADRRADFRMNEFVGGAMMSYVAGPSTLVGGHLSYETNRYGPGHDPDLPHIDDLFSPAAVPGYRADVDYLVTGTYAALDTRNVASPVRFGSNFAPTQERLRGLSLEATRGVYLAGEAEVYVDVGSDAYSYLRIDLEAQQFVPLRGGYQVVALRQYAAVTHTGADRAVPFYQMPALSGSGAVRGYGHSFRDRNALLFNAEYRWAVLPVLNAALFLDAGHVFPAVRAIGLRNLEVGGGIGMRVKSGRRVLLRTDLAFGREGARLYFGIGSIL